MALYSDAMKKVPCILLLRMGDSLTSRNGQVGHDCLNHDWNLIIAFLHRILTRDPVCGRWNGGTDSFLEWRALRFTPWSAHRFLCFIAGRRTTAWLGHGFPHLTSHRTHSKLWVFSNPSLTVYGVICATNDVVIKKMSSYSTWSIAQNTKSSDHSEQRQNATDHMRNADTRRKVKLIRASANSDQCKLWKLARCSFKGNLIILAYTPSR